MAKGSKSFKKKKSSDMKKRVKKLEEQMLPVLKTFEQRQHDYVSAVSVGQSGYALSYATSAAWTLNSLCSTAEMQTFSPNYVPGALGGKSQRIGNKITLRSLSIKGEVRASFNNATGAEIDNRVRLILVRYSEYDTASPPSAAQITSDILQLYSTSMTSPYSSNLTSIYSPLKNLVTADNARPMVKYEILEDRVYHLTNPIGTNTVGQAATNAKQPYCHKFHIKKFWKKGLVVEYDKPANSMPCINNIALIALSDSSVAPHPQINFVSRAKYMDV